MHFAVFLKGRVPKRFFEETIICRSTSMKNRRSKRIADTVEVVFLVGDRSDIGGKTKEGVGCIAIMNVDFVESWS